MRMSECSFPDCDCAGVQQCRIAIRDEIDYIKKQYWVITPWYLRLLGKPKYRHRVDNSQPYTPIFYWEYSNIKPECLDNVENA